MTPGPRRDPRQSPAPETRGGVFFGRLESLRGMAALCVALYHSLVWMPVAGQPVSIRPITEVHGLEAILTRILIAAAHGSSWVAVFFVLSGFVLANSLEGRRLLSAPGWLRFVVRRTFRIMPALAASLIFIVAMLAIRARFGLFPQGYDWYEVWKAGVPTWQAFWRNAGLVNFALNPPSWSLRVEMVGALAFPLMLLVCRRFGLVGNLVVWTLIAVAWSSLHFRLLAPLLLFVIGINGYLFGARLLARVPDRALPLVGLGSLALIVLPNLWLVDFRLPQTLATGFGGVGLIVLLSSERIARGTAWLNSAPARFIGRVSFSFYLLHYMVLYATTLAMTQYAPALREPYPALFMLASAAISIALCAALSWAMYVGVEQPFNRLGRRLTREPS